MSSMPDAAGPAVSAVTGAVPGLSSGQAAAGMGGLLALAQAKMAPEQYAQVANAIPGSDALIGGAMKQGLSTTGLTGLSDLKGLFDNVGISSDQVSQMIPAVGNVVSRTAGPQVGQSFLMAMK